MIAAALRRRAPAIVCLLVLVLAGCTSQDAQALKDQAEDAAAAVSSAELPDLGALEDLIAAGNAELQATTTQLRRRLKSMEERLTALERDLDAVAADAETVAGVEASTGELAEQVEMLSAELDRLAAQGGSASGDALLDPAACVAAGGEWNAVLAACAR